MSSPSGFSSALLIQVKPSKIRLALTAGIHLLGFAVLWQSDLFGAGVALALSFALIASFIHDALRQGSFRRFRPRAYDAFLLVQLHHANSQWRGVFANGEAADLYPVGMAYIGRWLTLIRLSYLENNGRRHVAVVVIGVDTVSARIYRRLGVLLRFGQPLAS